MLPELGNGLAGMDVDHLCRNRACVNPKHLELVSHKENLRRGAMTKLTATQVMEIRRVYAEGQVTMRGLATEYGVHSAHISRIISGKVHVL